VFCDWLSPCHVATLPLVVYEPLTLTCLEHSAGEESSFLQLLMQNTSPLPLLIRNPQLASQVELDRLHGSLPQVSVAACGCMVELHPGAHGGAAHPPLPWGAWWNCPPWCAWWNCPPWCAWWSRPPATALGRNSLACRTPRSGGGVWCLRVQQLVPMMLIGHKHCMHSVLFPQIVCIVYCMHSVLYA
jgi:hypothetical protein